MAIGAWILLGIISTALMMFASRQAVRSGMAIAQHFNVSPLLIGMTMFAIGTDVPEIVNSFVSTYHGHGDVNVGDSIGSVFVQGTVVLGLFPIILQRSLTVHAKIIVVPTLLTIVALGLGIWLLSDGDFSRPDAALLLLFWPIAIVICWRHRINELDATPKSTIVSGPSRHFMLVGTSLVLVAVAAHFLLQAIVQLSALLSVPEYVLSFFGAAIGTSLPELAVEITALRQGNVLLAIGDVLGSCLVDASLSVAAGPLFFPTPVTADLMQSGALLAIVAMASIVLLVGLRRRHDYLSTCALLGLYLFSYFIL